MRIISCLCYYSRWRERNIEVIVDVLYRLQTQYVALASENHTTQVVIALPSHSYVCQLIIIARRLLEVHLTLDRMSCYFSARSHGVICEEGQAAAC